MAKRTRTTLTFAVTLRDLEGINIPTARGFIKEALESYQGSYSDRDSPLCDIDLDAVTVHLTNKEVKYG